MEQSIKSADKGRLHLHVFVEFTHKVDWTTVAPMRFDNVLPNASPTQARGKNQRTVVDQGHFYVFANKVGTLKVATSGHEPWAEYKVCGWWLDELWSQHKLSHHVYIDYAASVRVGYLTRVRQANALIEREAKAILTAKRNQISNLLEPLQKPWRQDVLMQLEPWKAQYGQVLGRYKFLVLLGASCTGKSSLARSLGKSPFVQTVQNATSLDLRDYSAERHDVIVLDNINDQQFVLDNRAVLQSNNDIHTLAESKTGIYSYSIWLWKVPIVMTVDDRAKWNSDDRWVKENCFEIKLVGPSWVPGPRGTPQRPPPMGHHDAEGDIDIPDLPFW